MRLLFRPTLVQHIKLQKIVESLRIEKKKYYRSPVLANVEHISRFTFDQFLNWYRTSNSK